MVFETLVFSPLNHLTRLIARENFIILSRRESNKSHVRNRSARFRCVFGSTDGKICSVFDFILHTAYTEHACALTSILPSLSLIDIFYGEHILILVEVNFLINLKALLGAHSSNQQYSHLSVITFCKPKLYLFESIRINNIT
jgi:hypothetical protein